MCLWDFLVLFCLFCFTPLIDFLSLTWYIVSIVAVSSFTIIFLLCRLPCWPSGKASVSRAEDPGFESRLHRDFLGSSHTSDLKIGTPVATLPGAWRYTYRVSTRTGGPGVSIL